MTSRWNTSGFPRPVTTEIVLDFLTKLLDGLNTAATCYSGSSDPSTGAPAAWGASEVGALWIDTTDTSNPKIKRWQLLTSPSTYGWRVLRTPKVKFLTAPKALTLAGSPAAANLAYADYDFTTDLDDGGSGAVQDAASRECAVRAVLLRVVIQTGASETIGTGATVNAYMKWREKGSTVEQFVRAHVANHQEEATIWVGLDASEIAQWGIEVGGGTAAFVFSASIIAILEET